MHGFGKSERLVKKVAVVTGAGRGIGRAISLRLASAGADVVLAARTESEIESAAVEVRALGRRALPLVTDVTVPDQVERLTERTGQEFGAADILVNNAALVGKGEVLDTPPEEWNQVLHAGLQSVYRVTRAFLPGMVKTNRGDIVMISSTSGKRADPGSSAYNATKHGLMGLSHALLYEVRPFNIRVTVVSPSAVDTRPLSSDRVSEGGKGVYLRMEDVADAVLFAVSLPHRALVREIELWGTNP
jgi:3-oxoacyl-[acyl-carrier protein] reductase